MLSVRNCTHAMASVVLIALAATASASETGDPIQNQLSELRRGGPFAEMAAGELALSARAAYESGRRTTAREIVSGLGALLRDADPRLRVAIIDALSSAGDAARDALPALRSTLQDAEAEVRVAAAQALARVGAPPEEILPTLIAGLALSPHRAIGALGQLGPAARPALGALLDLAPRASKAGTAKSLIAAVSTIDSASVPDLERRIDDGRRTHAAELVAQLQARPDTGAERGLEALGAVGVESLVEVLRQRPPPGPRVTYVLPQRPGAPSAQGMVAISPMSSLAQLPRVRAEQALGRMGIAAAAAVPTLVETLEDDSEAVEVRILAAESLGRIAADPGRALPALTSALSRSEQAFGPFGPNSLRGAAAEALGHYGHHAVSTADALRKARRIEADPAIIRLIDQALERVGRPSREQL